jgi:electron transfer flavoprotein beta subunit
LNLMQARKKPIETLVAADLVSDLSARLSLLQVAEPPARKPGIKVDSVDALLQQLRAKEGIEL